MNGPMHYRFRDQLAGEDSIIHVDTFNVVSETPKGYWVVVTGVDWPEGIDKYKRWVSKTSAKRFCYPTLEEAFASYSRRNAKRLSILKSQLQSVMLLREAINEIRADDISLETFILPRGMFIGKHYHVKRGFA